MQKLKLSTLGILHLGLIIASIVCLCLIAGLSRFILAERVGELGVEVGINLIILISVILGGLPVVRMMSSKISACILFTLSILMIVVILGLLMDGEFENIPFRVASIMSAGAVLCTFFLNVGKKRKRTKHAYR